MADPLTFYQVMAWIGWGMYGLTTAIVCVAAGWWDDLYCWRYPLFNWGLCD